MPAVQGYWLTVQRETVFNQVFVFNHQNGLRNIESLKIRNLLMFNKICSMALQLKFNL